MSRRCVLCNELDGNLCGVVSPGKHMRAQQGNMPAKGRRRQKQLVGRKNCRNIFFLLVQITPLSLSKYHVNIHKICSLCYKFGEI